MGTVALLENLTQNPLQLQTVPTTMFAVEINERTHRKIYETNFDFIYTTQLLKLAIQRFVSKCIKSILYICGLT